MVKKGKKAKTTEEASQFRDALERQLEEDARPKITRRTFIDFLRADIGAEESCMTLPHAIMLLSIFAVCVMVHMETEVEYSIQNCIRNEVLEGMVWFDPMHPNIGQGGGHLNLRDIIIQPDWWQWFEEGVVPRLWMRHDYRGEPLNPAHWDRMLEFNKILSSVRLRQERDATAPCDGGEIGAIFYEGECHNTGTRTGQTFGENNITFEQVPGRDDGDQVFEVWLDAMWPPEKVKERVDELKRGKFIDRQTRKLSLTLTIYNGELSSGMMGQIELDFYFQLGGFIRVKINIETFHTEPYQHMEILIVDVIFLWLVASMALGEVKEMVPMIRKGKLNEYLGVWNIVDWISILTSASMVLTWVILTFTAGSVASDLQEIANLEKEFVFNDTAVRDWTPPDPAVMGVYRDETMVGPSMALQTKYEEVFETIGSALSLQTQLRVNCALYCVVLMMRFFKSFAAQPKLAQVTKTIAESTKDIIHFFLVFITIFICYAIAGMVVFGSQLYKFSELHLAFYEAFETLFGVFDFADLYYVDPFSAVLWFFSFNILVLLIMLNMLLAIIMDQYTDVKGKATDAVTLWAQATTLLRRQRENQLGLRMELSDVLIEVESNEWDKGDIITADILVSGIPKLPPKQASRLIQRCIAFIKLEQSQGVGLSDAIRQVCHVDQVIHFIIEQQLQMMDMLQEACAAVPTETKLDTTRGMRKFNDVLSKLDFQDPQMEELRTIHKRVSSDSLADPSVPPLAALGDSVAPIAPLGYAVTGPTHAASSKASSSGNHVVLVD